MKKIILIAIICINCIMSIKADGFGYDYELRLFDDKDWYKVRKGEKYGIISKEEGNDDDIRVILSIEFQDFEFKEGKATMLRENMLYGYVGLSGQVKWFNPDSVFMVNPFMRTFNDGFVMVRNNKYKWGYMDEYQNMITINKKPFRFDVVYPFNEGIAAVYEKKIGWRYIDKDGNDRFIWDNPLDIMFCSTVHDGECIIIDSEGIHWCVEDQSSHRAMRKLTLSENPVTLQSSIDFRDEKLNCSEGVFTLDKLRRVVKYENNKGQIKEFIAKEKLQQVSARKVKTPIIQREQHIDTLSIAEDLEINVISRVLQANAKGRAYTEVKITNKAADVFEDITVTLSCGGASRTWTGNIEGNSSERIGLNIPSRFSVASIKRDIIVKVKFKGDSIENEIPITIRRYTPDR